MEIAVFISCVLLLSAFTFSFAGFGFGLVAVPLLALALPIKDAVAIQLPFSVFLVVINSFRYGKSIKWNELKPLFIGSAAAMPVGVFSLNFFPDNLMKRALALFIVLVVLFERTRQGQAKFGEFARAGSGGMILGMISGWFIGAYTTGGPPAVIYATARFPDPWKAKGAMGIYFLATDVVIVIMFIFSVASLYACRTCRLSCRIIFLQKHHEAELHSGCAFSAISGSRHVMRIKQSVSV